MISVCIHIHTHTHKQTHIHLYTHTHTQVSPPFLILEEGGTNQLQCLARGSPLPTIYWIYVDEFQKIETPNTPFLDAVFTLLSVEKEGHYVCYATNEHGVQLAEAIVAGM